MSKIIAEHHSLGRVIETVEENGFSFITIEHKTCSGKISLYGGHVLAWQPTNEKAVIWLSKDAIYKEGKAIRGGIPLCWPWFGPLEGTNQHGFARQVTWQLNDIEISEQGVAVRISWQGQNMDVKWPHKTKLEQHLFFGKTFTQSLLMHNLTDQPIEYTGALHSYFVVSSPKNITVPDLAKSDFYDKLTDQKVPAFTRKNCIGPIDTVYYCADEQRLVDAEWQRVIKIVNKNTHEWVLWNPGKETADNMADLHSGAENEYVCLEAANTKQQQISANSTHTISQIISVEKI